MTIDSQWKASSVLVNNINVCWHKNILKLGFHEEVAKCVLARFQVLNHCITKASIQILELLAFFSAPTNALLK